MECFRERAKRNRDKRVIRICGYLLISCFSPSACICVHGTCDTLMLMLYDAPRRTLKDAETRNRLQLDSESVGRQVTKLGRGSKESRPLLSVSRFTCMCILSFSLSPPLPVSSFLVPWLSTAAPLRVALHSMHHRITVYKSYSGDERRKNKKEKNTHIFLDFFSNIQ